MWRCIHLKDGIIAETKNSRLLKADLPATYAELVELAANAGIPADVLFNAEGWQQLPTFLNKKNLLQDSTAGLLGLTGDPTVDDAFVALLLTVKQMALVRVTVTVAGSPAIADIEVTGLEGLDGGAVYTDASGEAVGFAPAGEVSISTPTYQDLPAAPAVTRELAAGEIVDVSLTIGSAPQAGDKSVTSTTSGIRFSPYVTGVDVCCIGGGAGGESGTTGDIYPEGYYYQGGNGGGQGTIKNSFGIVPDTKQEYTAEVGAKGLGSYNRKASAPTSFATNGGDTSFLGVIASGGRVNAGGQGAVYRYSPYESPNTTEIEATTGSSNTVHIFNDESIPLTGGSGGGSGTYGSRSGAPGGSPKGGAGGDYDYSATGGLGYGAGGGGNYSNSSNVKVGGDGYQGFIRYRWRVA